MSSLHLPMCLVWKTVLKQTCTNFVHCSFTSDVLGHQQLFLCCPCLTLGTLSLNHSPRLNVLWQLFLGICFPFPQFMGSLASSPKPAKENSFSDFLCRWDRHCFAERQASERRTLWLSCSGLRQMCVTQQVNGTQECCEQAPAWETHSPLLRVSL